MINSNKIELVACDIVSQLADWYHESLSDEVNYFEKVKYVTEEIETLIENLPPKA